VVVAGLIWVFGVVRWFFGFVMLLGSEEFIPPLYKAGCMESRRTPGADRPLYWFLHAISIRIQIDGKYDGWSRYLN